MSTPIDLTKLQTEARNPNSTTIDQVSTLTLCEIINAEDITVAQTITKSLPIIAATIDALEKRFRLDGRLIYVGAGTSGRLGVLDASEIPPTFSASPEKFIAIIAGGDKALRHAQEGAEDNPQAAEQDLVSLDLNPDCDSVIGIAASGRTPYVLSCLAYAKSKGCTTIGLACTEPSVISEEANVDFMISVVTGPEVVTGSTRMKAGTATKLVLNMLSSGVMIRLGKTYGNMMIDVKATNVKLEQRARNILRTVCGSLCPGSDDEIDKVLRECHWSVKLAAATILLCCSVEEAERRLNEANGVLATILKSSAMEISSVNEKDKIDVEESYVLSIDGGGSKCAAVIIGKNGNKGFGEAGGCNVSNIGVEAAISSITLAIQRAVDSCPATNSKAFQSIHFSEIWIGLAGYDRPDMEIQVEAALTSILGVSVGNRLRVSNDIDLPAQAIGNQYQTNSAVMVVAGTGSVVMSYMRKEEVFERTGRAGGWGYLLGDDGSGYSIGRQGLRKALEFADELELRRNSGKSDLPMEPLVKAIFDSFNSEGHEMATVDLLSSILSCGSSATTMTRRIADVAKIVVEASILDDKAKMIINSATKDLVGTVRSLISCGNVKAPETLLILGGGLMQSRTYQELFRSNLLSSGIQFANIKIVGHPALVVAEYLAQLQQEI